MNLVRNLIGSLCLPVCLLMGFTLGRDLWVLSWLKMPLLAFGLGFVAYLVTHAVFYKPIFMHVMGHELTHAFWSFLFGGKIESLHVTPGGGKVVLTRSNFLITLAPYFFPFYTFLLLPVYFIARETLAPYVLFFVGASIAFHLTLTAYSLWLEQSDLKMFGTVFSLAFILLANVCMLAALFSILLPGQFPFIKFWKDLAADAVRGGTGCWNFLVHGKW